ncbi:MAG: hypothetical protein M0O99_01640 [Desulfuromonas thiophila]|jgi:K+ transporter|nr:hypothetical protein [Desulfuromonas thiophila]
MTEKMLYTQFLQANIRRYGWQSFIIKIASVFLTLAFLLSAFSSPSALNISSGASLWLACAVVLAFLLWCGDGHSADMMDQYNQLYEAAQQEKVQGAKMKIDCNHLSVTAIWRPTILAFHVPMMAMLILMGLAAK